jgi:hypothetical protein
MELKSQLSGQIQHMTAYKERYFLKNERSKEMKKYIINMVCLSIIFLLSTSQAQASTIYTFDAHGTAASDGRPNNGSAVFDFIDLNNLSITIANTAGPSQLAGISSVLDGLQFTLSNIPTTITLTGAKAAGTVKVPDNQSNPVVFNDPLGGITAVGANPFGWTLQASSGGWLLAAGAGSFKPNGIVNHNIQNLDGLGNAQHNPYLDGPVTFNFTLAGLNAIPQVQGANLYFGTAPDVQKASPVPLPGALMLFGPGLAGLVLLRRRVIK